MAIYLHIDHLIDEVIDREGGYSNHPADRGGATCWGITEAVARAHGYRGEMRCLPRGEAVSIYHELYWVKPGFDAVAERAPRIAAELFDTGVNMGPGTATGFLKRTLNALNRGEVDYDDIGSTPIIDAAALSALDAFMAKRGPGGETILLKALEALQGERYLRLAEKRPANEAFLYGWLANRIG
ncbi:MAG: glycosyl hydrolase 108 family protein [Pseudomonadota bacterium]